MKQQHTPPSPTTLRALISAALVNATSLVAEADCLSDRKYWARTHFLAVTALEELSKAQLVNGILTGEEPLGRLREALSSHPRKFAYLKRSGGSPEPETALDHARQSGATAKAQRERALYVGISPTQEVEKPSTSISEEQAKQSLQEAHDELSAASLLSLSPDGLSTKGAQEFTRNLLKGA
jgi:AbiV family abortive infection protein